MPWSNNTQFNDAQYKGLIFNTQHKQDSAFSAVMLSAAMLSDAMLSDAILSGAVLSDAVLSDAMLSAAWILSVAFFHCYTECRYAKL